MKKIIFFTCLMIFSLGISAASAIKSDDGKTIASDKKENKLSEAEIKHLTQRVEEIRDMDKSNLTFSEKRDLRNELTAIKKDMRKEGTVIYVSVGTVLLVVLLLIILL
jgi:hypothetical protein